MGGLSFYCTDNNTVIRFVEQEERGPLTKLMMWIMQMSKISLISNLHILTQVYMPSSLIVMLHEKTPHEISNIFQHFEYQMQQNDVT